MKIQPMTTETMQTILQNCPVGVLALDRQRRILWTNPALDNLLGIAPQSLDGRGSEKMDRDDLKALFDDSAHLSVLGVDGQPRYLCRARIASQGDEHVAELHYFTDQTEHRHLQEELRRARSQADSLRLVESDTGVMSRRALMLVLEPQVARSRRYNSPLTAVTLGVRFNEDADAQAGAREVSQVLKDQLRWADLVGRDDNGDFLVVLPETGRDAAVAITDKLAEALARNTKIADARFGVVEWGKSDNATGLLQRAREAMLTSSGRADSSRATH